MLSSVFDRLCRLREDGDMLAVPVNVISVLVQIHAEAYMLTLTHTVSQPYMEVYSSGPLYLSMHVPGNLAPTLFAIKPCFSNSDVYQGLSPAERRSTLPPIFRARYSAFTCTSASVSPGLNQSMLSMIYEFLAHCDCATLKIPDAVHLQPHDSESRVVVVRLLLGAHQYGYAVHLRLQAVRACGALAPIDIADDI